MVKDTILLFLANSSNRRLLGEWLQQHYMVTYGQSEADLKSPFQLCILDGPILDRYEAAIQERRAAAHPIFLPFLLVTGRSDVHLYTRHLWRTIDELAISPIQKAELQARVEILLRARRLALEVNRLQQALLTNAQTWLQLAVQAAQIGLWEWDLATDRVFFSPEWKAQIGYAADELPDTFTTWEEQLHPDDRERCLDTLRRYLNQPWPNFALEYRFRHKDGSYRWIRSQAAAIYDQHGRITHMLGAHLDLTERKQMEEERQHLSEQLFQSQKLEAIGALASGIAHDLNNLLVPIIGFAEMGLLEAPPESELYHDFDQIRAAGIRATALTRQILAFSRRQQLELKPVHLNQIISEFGSILRRLIGERIRILLDLNPALPTILADTGQIEQILLNLVINARDAIEGQGAITIATSPVQIDPEQIHLLPNLAPGTYAALQVSDTGCGIDPALLPRIFEPFFTTKPHGKGTGLGLSTVFGIVKQHRGHIDVQSKPGQGTTFTIYFPAPGEDQPQSEMTPAIGHMPGGHETVLVVEDEPAVLHLISSALRLHGYLVLEAIEPQHGLALATNHAGPIHLLISDLMLPVISGLELYQRMLDLRPELKVLFISAHTGIEPTIPADMPLLAKPFTLQQLLQRIRALLTAV
ncbi:hybrid sensor histidine kinase/response regulator [Chloroflexus sp.]|uniref:hybrid sensor histidine kinase/response regulator n=1 Tax=Chloroflexus sp. TaxID=1904827 RepID=UPI002621FECD|nr:PAS domain-containing sensor histidine kinase [uncultured Chloroflexus sp.]